jgi:TonB family protein
MSTILKDAELSAGTQSAGPQSLPQSESRSSAEAPGKPQPVALEISVSVNGARTLEGSDKREPFSETTKTVLVFGNGAVIRLQASVAPGQLLFLTNEKTKKEVVCQVVKSKNYRSVSGYVELEFTEAVPGFWGMRFPGDRIAPAAATPTVSQPPVAPSPAAGIPSAPSATAPQAVPPASVSQKHVPDSAAHDAKSPAVANTSNLPPAPASSSTPPAEPISKSAPAPVAPPVALPAPIAPSSQATPFLVKPNVSVSSTASSSGLSLPSVLSLPRAAEAKPSPLAPISLTPEPAAPLTPVSNTANSAPEDPTAALKAENARLQQQLTSLLFAENKKSASVTAPPSATTETVEPPAIRNSSPSTVTNPTATPVPPPVVAVQPPAPAKVPAAPLPSFLDNEELKIPSWLEPLARNAAISAPAADASGDLSGLSFEHEAHTLTPASLQPSAHHTPNAQDPSLKHSAEQEIASLGSELHEQSSSKSASPSESEDESLATLFEPNFGSGLRLDENAGDSAPRSNKKLFLAIAAALVLAAVGGLWYTGQAASILNALQGTAKNAPAASSAAAPSSASANNSQVPTPAQPNQSVSNSPAFTAANKQPVGVIPAGSIKDKAATPAPLSANLVVSPNRAGVSPASVSAVSAAVNSASPSAAQPSVQPPAPAQKRSSLGDVHLAGPTAAHRADDSINDADPGLNSSAPSADVPVSANFAATSGPAVPVAPIPVGGDVKNAKLLKSVPPVYPAFARTQRISGDVKIDALIDATGKVTTMKVIGGPVMLHQAAMDALRQWRYQPATLDGNAIAMHLTVTVQFRVQ